MCRAFNSYEEKIMEHKDERVRQLTEALQVCLLADWLAATDC
jgi:LPS O-antigen subunit length determinant protein (WzzB/FepE family)